MEHSTLNHVDLPKCFEGITPGNLDNDLLRLPLDFLQEEASTTPTRMTTPRSRRTPRAIASS